MAEASIEEQILLGEHLAWVLERKRPSVRGQVKIDGIIIASAKESLKLKVVRRLDGDHRLLLGKSGAAGQPIAALKDLLPEVQKARLEPYHLVAGEGSKELAVLYVPAGASLKAFSEAAGALIHIELPWDKHSPFENPLRKSKKLT